MDRATRTQRCMAVRRVIGDLLIVLTLSLTADVVFVMLRRIGAVARRDTYISVFGYELLLCLNLLLLSLDIRFGWLARFKGKSSRRIALLFKVAAIALAAMTIFFCGRIVAGGMTRDDRPAAHAIVPGMALEDGVPTHDLISRLEAAQHYLESYPDATLLLSGGNPDAFGRTEAAVMRDILLERGVPETRMRVEDSAEDTPENFTNAAKLIDTDAPVVVITSDYHMDRAVRTAHYAGFANVLLLPARSDPMAYGANLMWEVVLGFRDLLYGW